MFNIYPWENIMYSGSASYIPYPLMTYGYINLIEDYDTFSFYKGIEKYVFTNNLNTKWTVMGKWNGKTIRCCSIFLTDREINVSVKELQNLKTKERNKLIFNCIVYRIMNMIHYKKLKKASQGTYFSGESVRFIYSDADCSNVNIPNEKPNIPVPEN